MTDINSPVMTVQLIDPESYGVASLLSGSYSVKAAHDTVLAAGRITPVKPGVRLAFPADVRLSFMLPVGANADLAIVNFDQTSSTKNNQFIDDLTIRIHNTSDLDITIRRGTPIATMITAIHKKIAIVDTESVKRFAATTIPSSAQGYIKQLREQDEEKFIETYFSESYPIEAIREAEGFKDTPDYIAKELFAAMNSEQRGQISFDYEQYKKQLLR